MLRLISPLRSIKHLSGYVRVSPSSAHPLETPPRFWLSQPSPTVSSVRRRRALGYRGAGAAQRRRDARRPSHRVNHYSYRSFLRERSLWIARDAYLSAPLRWHPPSVAPRRIGRSTERPRRHRAFDGSIHASSATTSVSSFVSRARSRDDSIAPLSDVRLFLASGVGVGEFSPASPVAPVADPRCPHAASEKLPSESVDARLLVRRTRASPRLVAASRLDASPSVVTHPSRHPPAAAELSTVQNG